MHTQRTHRKSFGLVAVGLCLVLGMAACGSSSKKSSNASTATTTASSGSGSGSGSGTPSGSPIKIGVICSCSGPFGTTVVDGWKVLQAWSKWVNANGGIGGHPVTLDEKDDANSPGTAQTDATEIVADHAQLMFDLSDYDSVWQKTVDAAHIPVVGGNVSFPPSYQDPNFYPSAQTGDSAVYASFAVAKKAGATNIGYLNCAEGCAVTVPLEQAASKALSLPIAYTGSFSATAPNYTAECVAAKQDKVSALFLAGSISVIARVANDCSTQNYNPIYVTEGTGFTDQALTSTGLKDHLWNEFPVLPYFSTAPVVTTMNAQLDKYFPGMRSNPLNWSEYAVQAWTGGLLIQAAAKNAGITPNQTVTTADITKGLNMVSNDNLGGFSPSLTLTAGKPHPVDCWYTARVQNGKATVIGGQTCEQGA